LYVADELFFSGTAAEITPIRSVDRIKVGTGGRGELTASIQKRFFEITKGEYPAPGDWLTYVRERQVTRPENNGQAAEVEGEPNASATGTVPTASTYLSATE
jgi:hypothetical protein